jgi:hypothetical protein
MPYALLEEGSTYADWKAACEVVSTVTFTLADLKEGFIILSQGDADGAGITRFAARFQDISSEIVIASLRSRYEIFCEAQDCGVDLEHEQPDVFSSLASKPLTPEDFYVFDGHEA